MNTELEIMTDEQILNTVIEAKNPVNSESRMTIENHLKNIASSVQGESSKFMITGKFKYKTKEPK